MAGNATIGALRVSLGLDSAQFTTGLKKAETSLGSFGRLSSAGIALVATAAATAATALGIATKHAIDHADALSKMSQKAGVSVEALSRLEYAAKLSDVSLEGLTGGLGKLSKSMADAATNAKGATATAFAALGISVRDANGNLRDTDTVFSEVADRFAHLEDGATKTSLAMAIFGKSGADLIPLLNSGADGLRKMAEQSDRVGQTVSTKAARAWEHFNDTLSSVGLAFDGVINKIVSDDGVIAAMQRLADFIASPKFSDGLVNLAGEFTKFADTSIREVDRIGKALDWLQNNIDISPIGTAGGGEDALVKKLGLTRSPLVAAGSSGAAGSGINGSAFLSPPTPAGYSWPALAGAGKTGSMAGGSGSTLPFDALGTSAVDTTSKIADLAKGLRTIAPAAANAQKLASDSLKGLAQSATGSLANLSGALSQLFKDNKAFAVSTAVLQGLQGVAYALGSSAPPWNFINAAAVGIEAAANVANILSTNENSTSMPGGSGGSGGQAAAAASKSSAINLTIRGSGMISVDDFASQLTKSIADGGNQQFVKVIRAA